MRSFISAMSFFMITIFKSYITNLSEQTVAGIPTSRQFLDSEKWHGATRTLDSDSHESHWEGLMTDFNYSEILLCTVILVQNIFM